MSKICEENANADFSFQRSWPKTKHDTYHTYIRKYFTDTKAKPSQSQTKLYFPLQHIKHHMKAFLGFYTFMGERPWPFILLPPLALIAFTIAGFSQQDIIENEVNKIWISKNGEFHKTQEYINSVKQYESDGGRTVFAAIAMSRDGNGEENLFTPPKLNEVLDRMAELDKVTVEYKGEIYNNQDLCYSNSFGPDTAYEFVCARFSPMDLFEETGQIEFTEQARLTWYNKLIFPQLVVPRLARYGVVLDYCLSDGVLSTGDHCDHDYKMRVDEEYAKAQGHPEYYNPFLFFEDIGQFEQNNRCNICLEKNFNDLMDDTTQKYKDIFSALEKRLVAEPLFVSSPVNGNLSSVALLGIVKESIADIDRRMIEEFFVYYNARRVYGNLAASSYAEAYNQFLGTDIATVCQDCISNITEAEAMKHLFNHADNTYSSDNTAGLPFPFWNEETGYAFDYSDSAVLKPIGGSGIDLSGEFINDVSTVGTGDLDVILNDPILVWTLAGHEPMTGSEYIIFFFILFGINIIFLLNAVYIIFL